MSRPECFDDTMMTLLVNDTVQCIFVNVSNYQAHAHLSQLFKPARAKWSTGACVQIRIITTIEFYLLADAFYRKN